MQTRSNPAHKPNQNHHPENHPNQAKTQPSQSPKQASTTQAKAQAANTKTPPTYPFPAYSFVKEQNDGTKFPVAKHSRLANTEAKFNPASALGGASVYSSD